MPSSPSSLMEVPYFDGSTLLTAASLSGGNVIATFVTMLQSWMSSLGVQDIPDEPLIYEKLISLTSEKESTSELEVNVTLWGERHMPGMKGAVVNIRPNNLELGDICMALLKGVVINLRKMMPLDLQQQLKVCTSLKGFIQKKREGCGRGSSAFVDKNTCSLHTLSFG